MGVGCHNLSRAFTLTQNTSHVSEDKWLNFYGDVKYIILVNKMEMCN